MTTHGRSLGLRRGGLGDERPLIRSHEKLLIDLGQLRKLRLDHSLTAFGCDEAVFHPFGQIRHGFLQMVEVVEDQHSYDVSLNVSGILTFDSDTVEDHLIPLRERESFLVVAWISYVSDEVEAITCDGIANGDETVPSDKAEQHVECEPPTLSKKRSA